jgi:muramoyltetrapeptide carboxypeptidase
VLGQRASLNFHGYPHLRHVHEPSISAVQAASASNP